MSALVVLLTALALGSHAHAHASLVRAEPADGAVVPQAPPVLKLIFNEPVSPLVVRLIAPSGAAIALDATAENMTVTVAPPAVLQRGTHVLSWRVISADGHPVAGSLLFSIGAPSATPPGDLLGDATVRTALWTTRVIIYAGLFIGIGGVFFGAWIGNAHSRAAAPWLVAVLLAGLAATVISVGLQGLDALGMLVSDLSRKAVWQAGLDTSYGVSAVVTAFALFAALLSLAAGTHVASRAGSLLALLGIGCALSVSGHAATAAPRLLTTPSVFIHSLCVAFWVGALVPLIVALRAGGTGSGALTRFSRLVPYPLALIFITGIALAFVQLARVDALWKTSYGLVLTGKLIAVFLLLALAAVNRYRLVPRFESEPEGSTRGLQITITAELVLTLTILGLVAGWRFTPPPRALAVSAPISVHLHGDKAMAQIELVPHEGSGTRASLQVLDGEFRPLTAKEVVLVLANPTAGIEPLRRAAVSAGGGIWHVDDLRIAVAGRWLVRVEILLSDFDKVMLEETITLAPAP